MRPTEIIVLPRAEPEAPPDPERVHRLQVRLDVAREQVLLWRVACVLAALTGLFLVRQLLLAG